MDENNNNSFWPSYVDIMTTLFAITLVLFAVSFGRFKVKENQLQGLVDEYENIIAVYSTVSAIDSTKYFGYNEQYLKHLFTVDVEYQQKEYRIDRLKQDLFDTEAADRKRDSIIKAGELIKNTIAKLEASNSIKDNNIKFLIVLEGQASKLRFDIDDWQNNYTLSYLRAQFLNEFWKENGINLEDIKRCELIISGSGEGGVPRNLTDDSKNQRFLIHIVPVIGNIDVTKEKLRHIKGSDL